MYFILSRFLRLPPCDVGARHSPWGFTTIQPLLIYRFVFISNIICLLLSIVQTERDLM